MYVVLNHRLTSCKQMQTDECLLRICSHTAMKIIENIVFFKKKHNEKYKYKKIKILEKELEDNSSLRKK